MSAEQQEKYPVKIAFLDTDQIQNCRDKWNKLADFYKEHNTENDPDIKDREDYIRKLANESTDDDIRIIAPLLSDLYMKVTTQLGTNLDKVMSGTFTVSWVNVSTDEDETEENNKEEC